MDFNLIHFKQDIDQILRQTKAVGQFKGGQVQGEDDSTLVMIKFIIEKLFHENNQKLMDKIQWYGSKPTMSKDLSVADIFMIQEIYKISEIRNQDGYITLNMLKELIGSVAKMDDKKIEILFKQVAKG